MDVEGGLASLGGCANIFGMRKSRQSKYKQGRLGERFVAGLRRVLRLVCAGDPKNGCTVFPARDHFL